MSLDSDAWINAYQDWQSPPWPGATTRFRPCRAKWRDGKLANLNHRNGLRKARDQRRHRVAVVMSAQPSSWVSCQKIARGLLAAYQATKSFEVKTVFSADIASEDRRTARAIAEADPWVISFIDNVRHPIGILKELAGLYAARSRRPLLVFHLYGDFLRAARQWWGAKIFLQDWPVRFLASSQCQTKVVARYLKDRKSISTLRFPADLNHFDFDLALRRRVREALNFCEEDLVIATVGRFSLTKNVHQVLRQFATLHRARGGHAKLLLCGHFDDLGSAALHLRPAVGAYRRRLGAELAGLRPAVRRDILYFGKGGPDVVKTLFNAADLYVSMSLYELEDFGLAALEALCCGLPLLTPNWGGPGELGRASRPFGSRAFPTRFNSAELAYETESEFRRLVSWERLRPTQRRELSRHFRTKYSPSRVGQDLDRLLNNAGRPFAGFASTLPGDLFAARSAVPDQKKFELFHRILSPYVPS